MSTLQNKVKKVINSSTDSPEMVEAIQTVSDLMVHRMHTGHTDGPNQENDERLFASLVGYGQDGLKTSAGAPSRGVGGSGIESKKRALRSDLEFRGLHLAEKVLQETKPLYDTVTSLENSVSGISSACETMKSRLESTQTQTDELLKQAERCQQEKEQVDRKLDQVNRFLRNHTLTREEVDMLYNADLNESSQRDEFLDILDRISSIRKQCNSIISQKHHMAGLQILETMAQYQEVGMDRLYQWLHHQSSLLGNPESTKERLEADDVMDSIYQALTVLSTRRAYFNASLDAIVDARRSYVLRSFIKVAKSLTQRLQENSESLHMDSSPSATSESVRVVSDILAWIHQTTASERDIIEPLIELASQASSGTGEEAEEENNSNCGPDNEKIGTKTSSKSSSDYLNDIVSAICKPLKVRIMNILETTYEIVDIARLVDVTMFFYAIFHNLLHPSGSSHDDDNTYDTDTKPDVQNVPVDLCQTMEDLISTAWDRLWGAVAEYRGNIEIQTMVCPSDLSSPVIATETIRKLEEVLSVFEKCLSGSMEVPHSDQIISSMLHDDGSSAQAPPDDRESSEKLSNAVLSDSVSKIVSSLVEPILDGCNKATEGLNFTDKSVFLLNTYQELQSNLSMFESSAPWVQYFASQISDWEEKLSHELYRRLLTSTSCDILPKLRAIQSFCQDKSEGQRLCDIKGLETQALQAALHSFYQILYDMSFNSLGRLKSPRMRERVKRGTAELLIKSHEDISSAVYNKNSGYPDPEKIVRHSTQDLRTILNVDSNSD